MVRHGFYVKSKNEEKTEPVFKSGRFSWIPLFSLFLSLILSEPPALLLMAFSAVLLHECGHVIVLFLLTREMPALKAEKFGLHSKDS